MAYGDEVLGSEVIGRRLDEFVRTEHGRSVQVLEATLSQYLTLVPRKVTPVCPSVCHAVWEARRAKRAFGRRLEASFLTDADVLCVDLPA